MESHLLSISLRRLQVFLAVCETMHVARAAERLGVAQPALSQQIKALEDALGVRLFHRRKRGIDLTAAGETCRDLAQAMIARHGDLIDKVRRTGRGELGSLSLGYVGSALFEARFPAQLRTMQESFPGIDLSLREGNLQRLLGDVAQGDLDAVLVRAPVPVARPLLHRVHSSQMLVALLPAGHPLAGRAAVAIADLAGEPMIGLPDADTVGIMRVATRLAAEAGLQLEVKWRVSDVGGVLGLVSAGLGYALVPGRLAELAGPQVVARPLTGAPPFSELWLIWHEERVTPALQRLLEIMPAG